MRKENKSFDLGALSAARGSLLGLATLWVVLFHSYNLNFFRSRILTQLRLAGPLTRLRETGNCGVDLFLFLSGLGLVYAWSRVKEQSAHPLRDFWRRRFSRVLPAYLAVSLLYYGLIGTEGIHDWMGKIFLYGFFSPVLDGGRYWYFAILFALYLLFPLIFRATEKWGLPGTLGMIALSVGATMMIRAFAPSAYFGDTEIMFTRIPVFILGVYFGLLSQRHARLPSWTPWVSLGLAVPVWFGASCIPVQWLFLRRYAYGLLTLLIALAHEVGS